MPHPTDAEWTVLTDYLDGEAVAGTKLKSTSGWYNNGNGTDDYGFSALPGDFRNYDNGTFHDVGSFGCWWSSTQSDAKYAWNRNMYYTTGMCTAAFTIRGTGYLCVVLGII